MVIFQNHFDLSGFAPSSSQEKRTGENIGDDEINHSKRHDGWIPVQCVFEQPFIKKYQNGRNQTDDKPCFNFHRNPPLFETITFIISRTKFFVKLKREEFNFAKRELHGKNNPAHLDNFLSTVYFFRNNE